MDLQQGIELVGQAIQYDANGQLNEAINLYSKALACFENAFNAEQDFARKNQILEKMKEYHDRMQLLSDAANQAANQEVAPQAATPTFTTPSSTQPTSIQNDYQSIQSPYSQNTTNLNSNLSVDNPYASVTPSNNSSSYNTPYSNNYSGTESVQSPYANIQASSTPSTPQNASLPAYNASPSPYSSSSIPNYAPPTPTAPSAAAQALVSQSTMNMTSSSALHSPLSSPSPYAGAYASNFTSLPSSAPPVAPSSSLHTLSSSLSSSTLLPLDSRSSGVMNSNSNYPLNNNMSSNNNMSTTTTISNSLSVAPAPAAASPYCAYLVQVLREHPRTTPNLQVALLVAEEAKKSDRSHQYQDALDMYTEALERFILVWNVESNQTIKQSLHNTIERYMQRAEKIKDACKLNPRRVPDNLPPTPTATLSTPPTVTRNAPLPPSSSSSAQSQSQYARPPLQQTPSSSSPSQPAALTRRPSASQGISGGGGASPAAGGRGSRIQEPFAEQGTLSIPDSLMQDEPPYPTSFEGKPIQIANETKSLIARQRLRLSVSVKSNLVFPGEKLQIFVKVDNRSSMVVNMLKVTLRRTERVQKYDHKSRPIIIGDPVKIHRQEFYQGSIFPLPAESNYSGELIYTVPLGLKPTNQTQAEIFERTYDLSVQCDLSMRKNLMVRFPLIIGVN